MQSQCISYDSCNETEEVQIVDLQQPLNSATMAQTLVWMGT